MVVSDTFLHFHLFSCVFFLFIYLLTLMTDIVLLSRVNFCMKMCFCLIYWWPHVQRVLMCHVLRTDVVFPGYYGDEDTILRPNNSQWPIDKHLQHSWQTMADQDPIPLPSSAPWKHSSLVNESGLQLESERYPKKYAEPKSYMTGHRMHNATNSVLKANTKV